MGQVLLFPAVERAQARLLNPRGDLVFLRGAGWELAFEPWRMTEVLEHLRLMEAGKVPLIVPVTKGELRGLIESVAELLRWEVN